MAVTTEEKTGTIADIYDQDSGRLTEEGTNNKWEFFQEGANIERKIGDGVIYLKVTTPTGKVIVTNIKTT